MHLSGQNICASRGGEPLFAGVNFTLGTNQLMTVTGPNGIGKSTLLRIIAGLLPPQQGTIVLQDDDITTQPQAYSHYLGSQNGMKAHISACDNLAFWADYQANALYSPIQALTHVELSHVAELPFGALSTGQKRRVALARLLISHRLIWIVDEPTSGLDQASSAIFTTLMQEHLQSGGIIIAATHLPLGMEAHIHLNLGHYADTNMGDSIWTQGWEEPA